MKEIIKVEGKRVLSRNMLLLFFLIVGLFSVYSSYVATKNYNVRDESGIAVKWNVNLEHAKNYFHGQQINDEYLLSMKSKEDSLLYVDETNLETLVYMNYDGKKLTDLSNEEIEKFYLERVKRIRENLDNNGNIVYSNQELYDFLQRAEKLTALSMGYAEGWKVLNVDMGGFESVLLVIIVIILLPFFGNDSQTKMRELYRSTKLGKKELDNARIIATFLTGSALYLLGTVLYFVIKIVPFGLEGGNQQIQSNITTFFSLYNISYWQQFLLNIMIGFVALIFLICFMMLITILIDSIMAGAAVLIFFWILLIIFDQMGQYQVNHWFANFMPLRMTTFNHFYNQNDIYRVFGKSMSCMEWNLLLTAILSLLLLLSTIIILNMRRKVKTK